MKEYRDWSARHVRLRAEMVGVALVTFLCARVGISVSGGSFLGLQVPDWLTRDVLAFWLTLIFLYLFMHFSVRTSAEMPRVTSQTAKLNRAIDRINGIVQRTSALVTRFSGALLSRRLAIWNETLCEVSVVPGASDVALLRDLGNKLDSLQALGGRIDAPAEQIKEEPKPSHAVTEGNVLQLEARQILETLAKLEEVGRAFNRRTTALDKALVETREVLTDARAFFSNERGHGAEDLNVKLEVAVGELRAVIQEFRSARCACFLDHRVFSVAIPKYISLLMVALSADAVFRGAETSGAHVASFMRNGLEAFGAISL